MKTSASWSLFLLAGKAWKAVFLDPLLAPLHCSLARPTVGLSTLEEVVGPLVGCRLHPRALIDLVYSLEAPVRNELL